MKDRKLYKVILLLGSNLSLGRMTPAQIIEEADKEIVDALLPDYLEVESLDEAARTTEIIKTEPCGVFDTEKDENGRELPTPEFYNQALCCITDKTPKELLFQIQRIEKLFGRQRTYKVKGETYQSRTLDIDILRIFESAQADKPADKGADKKKEWVELKLNTPDITVPHTQIQTRDFVAPLLKKLHC